MQEYQASDAEISQYQDYFVETTNEYEKMLESINKELEGTQEGLKELNGMLRAMFITHSNWQRSLLVQLLTINNEMLVYNNPIFSGHNPHLEKEE